MADLDRLKLELDLSRKNNDVSGEISVLKKIKSLQSQAQQGTLEPGVAKSLLIGVGKGITGLGQGAKQLGLETGAALGLIPQRDVSDYTKSVQEENALFQNTPVGQSTSGNIGEFIGGVLPLAPVPGGVAGNLLQRAGTAALAGGLLGGASFVPEGGSRVENAALGTLLGAAAPPAIAGLAGIGKGIGSLAGLRSAGPTPLNLTPSTDIANTIGRGVDTVNLGLTGNQGVLQQRALEGLTSLPGGAAGLQAPLERVAAAERFGNIPLLPSEASGSQLAGAFEGRVGKTREGVALLQRTWDQRAGKESEAINNFLYDISPSSTPAYEDVRKAAQKVIGEKRTQLSELAKPFYEAARNEQVNTQSLNQLIQKDPNIQKAIEDVANSRVYQREIGVSGREPFQMTQNDIENLINQAPASMRESLAGMTPEEIGKTLGISGDKLPFAGRNTVGFLDLAKRRLGDQISSARRSGNLNEARLYQDSYNDLRDLLRNSSENFKKATALYSDEAVGAPALEKLEKSAIGRLASLSDEDLKKVVPTIFDPGQKDLRRLGKIRDTISKQDPEAWNRLIRNHIENKLDASRNLSGDVGEQNISQLYRSIMGSDRDVKIMREALKNNPKALSKFNDARFAFQYLTNPATSRTAKKLAETSMSLSRDALQHALNLAQSISGSKFDKAAIEFLTNNKWTKAYEDAIKGVKTSGIKANKLGLLLDEIANGASNVNQVNKLSRAVVPMKQQEERK